MTTYSIAFIEKQNMIITDSHVFFRNLKEKWLYLTIVFFGLL